MLANLEAVIFDLDGTRDGFPSACSLLPDAAQTLSSLRAAGFKLGLITNGSVRMQSCKLKCLALEPAFDTVLISDAEGVSKPDPEIFSRSSVWNAKTRSAGRSRRRPCDNQPPR